MSEKGKQQEETQERNEKVHSRLLTATRRAKRRKKVRL